jgi:hypothetical protein
VPEAVQVLGVPRDRPANLVEADAGAQPSARTRSALTPGGVVARPVGDRRDDEGPPGQRDDALGQLAVLQLVPSPML